MKFILLSGGSGKRLWPMSVGDKSKQFLKVYRNSDEGNEPESMLQRAFRLLKKTCDKSDILISSTKNQKDIIYDQIGKNVNLVLEPEQKDTFPAIALAALYLKYLGEDSNSILTIMPVDCLVDEEFYRFLSENEQVINSSAFDILLIGVKPTYPTQKYGYILRENSAEVSRVISFKEKPSASKAAELIASGALWNAGVFCVKLGYIVKLIEQKLGINDYSTLQNSFGNLEKISFDYAVLESSRNIGVRFYPGVWKDVGTWNTFVEEMATPTMGKVVYDPSCTNINVINQLNSPVMLSGVKDIIVVATEDGILVASHNGSSYIKPLVERLEFEKPNDKLD